MRWSEWDNRPPGAALLKTDPEIAESIYDEIRRKG